MKNYIYNNRKGLLLVSIGFVSLFLLFSLNFRTSQVDKKRIKSLNEIEELSMEEIKDITLDSYKDEIKFYAKTFKIEENILYQELKNNYDTLNINKNMDIDKVLIDFLFNLESTNKKLFNNKITSGLGTDKEYILSLIDYFCSIYPNVDFTIASSIAHIESGFRAKTMLKNNNIFGGMARGKLISYKTIEYGVLKYIKLLSESYFGLGLNTVETIGKKYNPVYENGVKKANPTWVKNVNAVMDKYQNYTDFLNILELEEM